MYTPNLTFVTAFALLTWPAVALFLYKTRPIGLATIWTILGAYMFLPVGAIIKFNMIPEFDKSSIPNLAALFGCVIVCGRPVRFFDRFGVAEFLIIALIVSPFITCELNADPIKIGGRVLPGLDSYDAGSAAVSQFINLIPFFLGRQFLRNRIDTEEILRALVIAGLIYSVPVLFETRFSPQLHTWLYGYFPTGFGFEDQMRDGGFRPVVFMGHGLLVSFFICTTAVAATAFWRTNTRVMRMLRLPASGITAYLCIVLVLCKSAGSTIYGATLVPLVRFTGPKFQLGFAVLLVSVALLYPILRTTDLVPTGTVLDLAGSISLQRRSSLNTRFINEDQILEHTSQRFMFGWGRFGRGWIYDENGYMKSKLDGTWIITLGEFGFVGFLSLFGLLALPVFSAVCACGFAESTKDRIFLSAVALILAISIVDLLPNSSLRPWTWLIAGALLGRAEALRLSARVQTARQVASAESSRMSKNPQSSVPSQVKRPVTFG
jgi:hypothetical protein